ncbi:MAG: hypothetical protein SGI87_08895 [Flavobacteriales bacterium]|nr:hypothetical protein [Flavobacteriales bacterium]
MEELVNVYIGYYSSSIILPRAELDAAGIYNSTKDELTAHVQPFYSSAIGGIKLQVRESDLNAARKILIEAGYLTEENPADLDKVTSTQKLIHRFEKSTSRIPVVRKWQLATRLFAIFILAIAAISVTVYFLTQGNL